jgi:hypothetical protein
VQTLLMVGKHTDDSGYCNASRKLLEFIAKVTRLRGIDFVRVFAAAGL